MIDSLGSPGGPVGEFEQQHTIHQRTFASHQSLPQLLGDKRHERMQQLQAEIHRLQEQ